MSIRFRGVFSTGAMGALASAMLKNKLLAPAIFEHFSTVGKIAGAKVLFIFRCSKIGKKKVRAIIC